MPSVDSGAEHSALHHMLPVGVLEGDLWAQYDHEHAHLHMCADDSVTAKKLVLDRILPCTKSSSANAITWSAGDSNHSGKDVQVKIHGVSE